MTAMKRTKVKFWEEAPGVQSGNRIAYMVGMAWLILMTTYGIVFMKWEAPTALAFFTGIAGVLTGGKLIQKSMETKPEQKEQEP